MAERGLFLPVLSSLSEHLPLEALDSHFCRVTAQNFTIRSVFHSIKYAIKCSTMYEKALWVFFFPRMSPLYYVFLFGGGARW